MASNLGSLRTEEQKLYWRIRTREQTLSQLLEQYYKVKESIIQTREELKGMQDDHKALKDEIKELEGY